jgi:hypothetical protein
MDHGKGSYWVRDEAEKQLLGKEIQIGRDVGEYI